MSTDKRSPLAIARGLGSAKDGVGHWWAQRLTAIALVPLTLWFVYVLLSMNGLGYDDARYWIASPVVAVTLVLYLAVLFYHSQLGLQEVVEDYVHHEGLKLATLVLLKFAHVVLAVAAIFAVLKIALA